MPHARVVTISRLLIDRERTYPQATGGVNKVGLVDILGRTGDENVHGEQVQKLDVYANEVLFRALDHTGHLAVLASEESEDPIPIPPAVPGGRSRGPVRSAGRLLEHRR